MQTERFEEEHAEGGVDERLLSPGEVLRKERFRLNLSEKEVAERLHITMHFVKAIESDSYEKLPGAVFAKGYIKSYADLLELESNDLLELYAAYIDSQRKKEKEESQVRGKRIRYKNQPWLIGFFIVILGVSVGLLVYGVFFAGDNSIAVPSVEPDLYLEQEKLTATTQSLTSLALLTDQLIPSSSSTMQNISINDVGFRLSVPNNLSSNNFGTNVPVSALIADAAGKQAPKESFTSPVTSNEVEPLNRTIEIMTTGSDLLRVAFSGESWVEVLDRDQNQIYRNIQSAGDIIEITGNAPFNILLGDAPFSHLTFNGNEIDVTENIRIDNSARFTVGL